MRAAMTWRLLLLAGVTCVPALAQNSVSPPPAPRLVPAPPQPAVVGGTVSGHVYAADTQRPARFADVELVQEATNTNNGGRFNRGPSYNSQGHARTALDGSFTIQNVPPGTYFVVATMTGYISPLQVARMSQAALNATQTQVASNGSADVVITMERGAVVTGRVLYDDGTPVAGVPVRLGLTTATGGNSLGFGSFGGAIAGSFFFGGGAMSETDDRGVYRVMGVPAGKYIVSTMVQTENVGEGRGGRGVFRGPPPILTVYAPATMHKSEGQNVEVHGGETIDGIDIRVTLNGLHTIKGSVEAKADSHMLNAGMATLSDAKDSSTMRSAAVSEDGSFKMDYVPAGTYTLNVSGLDRTLDPNGGGRPGSTTIRRYTPASVSVTVGDHDTTLDPVQLDEARSSTTTQAGNR